MEAASIGGEMSADDGASFSFRLLMPTANLLSSLFSWWTFTLNPGSSAAGRPPDAEELAAEVPGVGDGRMTGLDAEEVAIVRGFGCGRTCSWRVADAVDLTSKFLPEPLKEKKL